MKTSISKTIHHSFLIEEDNLDSLFRFLSAKYKNITIKAQCIDGTEIETKVMDEILDFENANYRKIKSIHVIAKEDDFDDVASLTIEVDNLSTAYLLIKSKLDDRALYNSQEIIKILKEMKPGYDWFARISVIHFLAVLGLTYSMGHTFLQMIGQLPFSKNPLPYSFIETFNIFILGLIIYAAIIYPIRRLQQWLFPQIFFLIGRQKKTMENIKNWRRFIFSGTIFTIVISIIANLITNMITK